MRLACCASLSLMGSIHKVIKFLVTSYCVMKMMWYDVRSCCDDSYDNNVMTFMSTRIHTYNLVHLTLLMCLPVLCTYSRSSVFNSVPSTPIIGYGIWYVIGLDCTSTLISFSDLQKDNITLSTWLQCKTIYSTFVDRAGLWGNLLLLQHCQL